MPRRPYWHLGRSWVERCGLVETPPLPVADWIASSVGWIVQSSQSAGNNYRVKYCQFGTQWHQLLRKLQAYYQQHTT